VVTKNQTIVASQSRTPWKGQIFTHNHVILTQNQTASLNFSFLEGKVLLLVYPKS